MRQIGGEKSELFSLDAKEFIALEAKIREGQLCAPLVVQHEGLGGGIVRFHSHEDANTAKLALA